MIAMARNQKKGWIRGDLPKTRFTTPVIARILFFFSSFLTFVALWQMYHRAVQRGAFDIADLAVGAFFASWGILGAVIHDLHKKRQQKLRDQRAATVLSRVRQGEKCNYSLYLRGFAVTGKLPQIESTRDPEPGGFRSEVEDMETFVAKAMEPTLPMIALGKPGEAVGAGRLEASEENWKDIFQLLASQAKALILVPSDTPGTRDEISWIREHRLWSKLIVIMPMGHRREGRERWESMRSSLKQIGLDLPEFRSCGMVFKMDEKGHLKLFQIQGHNKMGQIITELIDDVGLTPDTDVIECPNCGYCEPQGARHYYGILTPLMGRSCGFCRASLQK